MKMIVPTYEDNSLVEQIKEVRTNVTTALAETIKEREKERYNFREYIKRKTPLFKKILIGCGVFFMISMFIATISLIVYCMIPKSSQIVKDRKEVRFDNRTIPTAVKPSIEYYDREPEITFYDYNTKSK